jgi:lysozyme
MAKYTKPIAGGAAIIAAVAAFLMPHEGEVRKPYKDPAGITTWCYGETQGQAKASYTHQECVDMLKERIPDYLGPVDEMMPNLPDNRRIAYADFAYNVGVATVKKSRIPSFEKSGDYKSACAELKRYVYAGGKVLPGLVTRRQQEYKLCMAG